MTKQENPLGNRNPIEVVNYILEKGDDLGKKFTPMQMIKLVYLAHGWFMALSKEEGKDIIPLIDAPVEAWRYGPVISVVYHAVKEFGSDPIEGPILGGDEKGANLTDSEKKIIDFVIEKYGDMSAMDLSILTHQEGTPWSQMGGIYYARIPNSTIYEHFANLLKKWTKDN